MTPISKSQHAAGQLTGEQLIHSRLVACDTHVCETYKIQGPNNKPSGHVDTTDKA